MVSKSWRLFANQGGNQKKQCRPPLIICDNPSGKRRLWIKNEGKAVTSSRITVANSFIILRVTRENKTFIKFGLHVVFDQSCFWNQQQLDNSRSQRQVHNTTSKKSNNLHKYAIANQCMIVDPFLQSQQVTTDFNINHKKIRGTKNQYSKLLSNQIMRVRCTFSIILIR